MIGPISIVAILFCIGILTEKFINIPFFYLYITTFIFLGMAIFMINSKKIFILLIAAAVFLFGVLAVKENRIVPKNHFSFFLQASRPVTLSGIVKTAPVSGKYFNNTFSSFMFEAEYLYLANEWLKTEGIIKVINYKKKDLFNYGDELLLMGDVSNRKGLYVLKIKKKGLVKLIGKDKGNSFKKTIFDFKASANSLIDKYLPKPHSYILTGMLLGNRQNIPKYLNDRFRSTGTIHILAISGLHVTLIATILFFIFSALHIPRNINSIIAIFFLLGYCVFTGANTPVVRATIMSVLFLLSILIKRENQIYNTLSIAALAILVFDPRQIYDIGFQLSFISVFSIIYLTPKFEGLFKRASNLRTFFFVSFSAWLGVLPLIAFYFKLISPVAILANLILVPLSFLNISSGIAFVIFGLIHPLLASIFGLGCWFFFHLLIISTNFFYRLPFGFFKAPSPPVIFILLYYFLLFGAAGRQKFFSKKYAKNT